MMPLRLAWIGAALGLTGLATLFFDRFDPARARRAKPARRRERRPEAADPGTPRMSMVGWADLSPAEFDFRFLRMWQAELTLMVKGYHWSWYLVAMGLIGVQLAVPYEYARTLGLPIAWLWPLALWSSMGTREARFNTGQLVFSSPYPEKRQFPALWLAGLTVAVLTGSGMMVRALLLGELAHLSALLVGAVFVPTLALFLGVTSGTKKLFEVSYLVIWYLAINQVAAFDFFGATDAAVASAVPQTDFVVSLVLLFSAFLYRRRQMISGIV